MDALHPSMEPSVNYSVRISPGTTIAHRISKCHIRRYTTQRPIDVAQNANLRRRHRAAPSSKDTRTPGLESHFWYLVDMVGPIAQSFVASQCKRRKRCVSPFSKPGPRQVCKDTW
ncbi:resistance protein RGA2 [Anopheles sinensis]|uniref:Resistance protein RGA2 n=1 Tax=Anopheles sinensis TaxID=74873 RepID=A0A084VPN9_ANOSI|nr:resistance protein RGA2 [Anopheles sinensis]